jgi:hypothetical protein
MLFVFNSTPNLFLLKILALGLLKLLRHGEVFNSSQSAVLSRRIFRKMFISFWIQYLVRFLPCIIQMERHAPVFLNLVSTMWIKQISEIDTFAYNCENIA